jgi:hypothetical protein
MDGAALKTAPGHGAELVSDVDLQEAPAAVKREVSRLNAGASRYGSTAGRRRAKQ